MGVMKRRVGRWTIGAVISMSVAGCLTEEGEGPVPAALSRVSGDGQTAPAGARLPVPLSVSVTTADGSPAVRGEVRWQLLDGTAGAVVSDTLTLADGFGIAQVSLTLGGTAGAHTVRAALEVDPDLAVTFGATATPPPTLTSVTPASFTSGDVVTVTGTELGSAPVFSIGGATARVQQVQAGGTMATVVVPPCRQPGPVDIVAAVDGARSNAVQGTFTASGSPIDLAVGEYVAVHPDVVASCATLPPSGPGGAEYLIAPQSVSRVPGDSVLFRVSGDPSTAPPPREVERGRTPWAVTFHDFLRARERELPVVPSGPPVGAARVPTIVAVGQRRNFVVCGDIGCSAVQDFENIRAEARFVGEHAVIYQDLDAPSDGFTAEDYAAFGAVFDDLLYGVDTEAFGAESDVDNNGRVVILLTPIVNGLTPLSQCSESFVTGFFFAVDINPAFARDERSNQAEVFYGLVPDPTGEVTCTHSTDRVRRLIPVTFVHEFQHMINYHQRVLVRGAAGPEVLWLNEGMSHLAEELAAEAFRAAGDDESFNRFAIGNLANLYGYLEDPEATASLSLEGTGALTERGAAWAFLRWIVDQFGDGVLRRLSETGLRGVENVEAATGEPIDRLLVDWYLANWVSDLPDFTAPSRLRYTSWSFRTTYASLNDQAPDLFPRPFPLEPEEFGGILGFNRTGVLRAGSGTYYRVIQGAGQPAFSLEFTLPNGQPLGDEGAARLNVVRIR